ncbi:hypothetical protein LCM27_01755 [Ruegeria marisrubri]|uniref:hypothetical protein n=1 Tax=Ruegeria marisrubri TaxID=1685379 RepID=UPI001CD7F19A|nr:hypothetical protein [Ruegeria marisrubri]MCA0905117.1 hypothetical protein [Ruegeria marisrubri]
MTIIEWIKLLWPMAVLLLGFIVRVEVGQTLTRWRNRQFEKNFEAIKSDTAKDIEAVHARLSRHETQTNSYLSEIRNDIKTLLARDK